MRLALWASRLSITAAAVITTRDHVIDCNRLSPARLLGARESLKSKSLSLAWWRHQLTSRRRMSSGDLLARKIATRSRALRRQSSQHGGDTIGFSRKFRWKPKPVVLNWGWIHATQGWMEEIQWREWSLRYNFNSTRAWNATEFSRQNTQRNFEISNFA